MDTETPLLNEISDAAESVRRAFEDEVRDTLVEFVKRARMVSFPGGDVEDFLYDQVYVLKKARDDRRAG